MVVDELEEDEAQEARGDLMLLATLTAVLATTQVVPSIASAGAATAVTPTTVHTTGIASMLLATRDLLQQTTGEMMFEA